MPATKKKAASAKKARRTTKRAAAQGDVPTDLPVAMTGRASPAKAAEGDKPVFDYIGSLPEPQRSIAKRVDALAAKTLPALKRSIKWGIAWYGVGDGWCFCCGGFAGHVKLTFGRGTSLEPVPPVTPIGMGKDSRGVDLESVDDLDERQAAAWMKQAAALPGFGGKKRATQAPRRTAKPAAPPPWFGPGETAACVTLEREIRALRAWGDETHPLFQEYVAREHLDGRMPITELHRNHGIPLSAVRRWIATFRDGGRAALTQAAREGNAKAGKRRNAP